MQSFSQIFGRSETLENSRRATILPTVQSNSDFSQYVIEFEFEAGTAGPTELAKQVVEELLQSWRLPASTAGSQHNTRFLERYAYTLRVSAWNNTNTVSSGILSNDTKSRLLNLIFASNFTSSSSTTYMQISVQGKSYLTTISSACTPEPEINVEPLDSNHAGMDICFDELALQAKIVVGIAEHVRQGESEDEDEEDEED